MTINNMSRRYSLVKVLFCSLPFVFLTGCSDSSPVVAGKMTENSICSTAGYLIRKNLGEHIKTAGERCTVTALSKQYVEINSGYKSPLREAPFRYTAIGYVNGDKLKLNQIQVHGIDDKLIRFEDFGF
ncbi:MAG: hypothetical protein ACK4GU_16155 [Alishewanella aestuarii]